jgi:hypothetical protein
MTDLVNEDSSSDDDLTIDGAEFLTRIGLAPTAAPARGEPTGLGAPPDPPSSPTLCLGRWVPPSPTGSPDHDVLGVRPGRLQLGVLGVALLLGLVLSILVLGPETAP